MARNIEIKAHVESIEALAAKAAAIADEGPIEIIEAVLARARDHFADAELCELIMFMGFMWAGGTFGAVLGLEPLHSSP